MNTESAEKYKSTIEFAELLGLSELELLQAAVSAFSPCQPGALLGTWKQRIAYKDPPTTQEIWKLQKDSGFKCIECGSYLRITIDHINDNSNDNSLHNLRILCSACNRARRHKVTNGKHLSARIYKAAVDFAKTHKRWPRPSEVAKVVGVKNIGGTNYMLSFIADKMGFEAATKSRPSISNGMKRREVKNEVSL